MGMGVSVSRKNTKMMQRLLGLFFCICLSQAAPPSEDRGYGCFGLIFAFGCPNTTTTAPSTTPTTTTTTTRKPISGQASDCDYKCTTAEEDAPAGSCNILFHGYKIGLCFPRLHGGACYGIPDECESCQDHVECPMEFPDPTKTIIDTLYDTDLEKRLHALVEHMRELIGLLTSEDQVTVNGLTDELLHTLLDQMQAMFEEVADNPNNENLKIDFDELKVQVKYLSEYKPHHITADAADNPDLEERLHAMVEQLRKLIELLISGDKSTVNGLTDELLNTLLEHIESMLDEVSDNPDNENLNTDFDELKEQLKYFSEYNPTEGISTTNPKTVKPEAPT